MLKLRSTDRSSSVSQTDRRSCQCDLRALSTEGMASSARELAQSDPSYQKKAGKLVSIALIAGASFVASEAVLPVAQAGVVRIGLQWDRSPSSECNGYTLYAGTLRPGGVTNDITSLDIFGSVVIPGGASETVSVNVGGVGPGSNLGFYLVANANSDGSGDVSPNSNVATFPISSAYYLANRVTNSTEIAIARSLPITVKTINGSAPAIVLTLGAVDQTSMALRIQGLRPSEHYTVEAASRPAGPFSPVYQGSAGVLGTNAYDEITIPKTGDAKFLRVKRDIM